MSTTQSLLAYTFDTHRGTYIVRELPNDRLHVFHRGSGLQGSMTRRGIDGPSWLSASMASALAGLFNVQAMGTPR